MSINFKENLEIINGRNYINRILDRYDIKDKYTNYECIQW